MSGVSGVSGVSVELDEELRLADGRTAREIHDEELAADRRVERWMIVKELVSFAIVIGVIVARQIWFV